MVITFPNKEVQNKFQTTFDNIIGQISNMSDEEAYALTNSDVFFAYGANIDYRNPDKITVSLTVGQEKDKYKLKEVIVYEGSDKNVARLVYANLTKGMNQLKSRYDQDGTFYYEGAWWDWEADNN